MQPAETDGGAFQSRGNAVRLACLATLGGLCMAAAGNLLYETLRDCAGGSVTAALQGCLLDAAPPVRMRYAWSGVLALVFFLLSLLAIPVARRAFFKSRARIIADGRRPRFRAVVFALSRQHELELDAAGMPLDPVRATKRATLQTLQAIERTRAMQPGQLAAILEELCDPGGPFAGWQWQQPLRMLRHNRAALTVWCVILTREAEAQYKAFQAVVAPLLAEMGASLERAGPPVGALDYNELTEAIDAAIRLCRADFACSHESTCVDMTGGTAAFSAAATVKTLNSRVRLGYVATLRAPTPGEIVVYEPSITG
jgi:hypothetical protein